MAPRTAARSIAISRLVSSGRGWRLDDDDVVAVQRKFAGAGVTVSHDDLRAFGRDLRSEAAVSNEALLRVFLAVFGEIRVENVVDPWTADGLIAASLVECGVAKSADVVTLRPESLLTHIARRGTRRRLFRMPRRLDDVPQVSASYRKIAVSVGSVGRKAAGICCR